jgi:hypothetical protein
MVDGKPTNEQTAGAFEREIQRCPNRLTRRTRRETEFTNAGKSGVWPREIEAYSVFRDFIYGFWTHPKGPAGFQRHQKWRSYSRKGTRKKFEDICYLRDGWQDHISFLSLTGTVLKADGKPAARTNSLDGRRETDLKDKQLEGRRETDQQANSGRL